MHGGRNSRRSSWQLSGLAWRRTGGAGRKSWGESLGCTHRSSPGTSRRSDRSSCSPSRAVSCAQMQMPKNGCAGMQRAVLVANERGGGGRLLSEVGRKSVCTKVHKSLLSTRRCSAPGDAAGICRRRRIPGRIFAASCAPVVPCDLDADPCRDQERDGLAEEAGHSEAPPGVAEGAGDDADGVEERAGNAGEESDAPEAVGADPSGRPLVPGVGLRQKLVQPCSCSASR
jgi:hypothetical protein